MSLALSGRANLVRSLLVAHGGMYSENATVTLGIKGDTIRNAIEVIDGLNNDNGNLWRMMEAKEDQIADLRLQIEKLRGELAEAKKPKRKKTKPKAQKPTNKKKVRRKK